MAKYWIMVDPARFEDRARMDPLTGAVEALQNWSGHENSIHSSHIHARN